MESLKELPLPSVDIPVQLTPEGQKAEKNEQNRESEKDFDTSQGFVPIEEKKAGTTSDSDKEEISDPASGVES
jgi:hypothetical protein